MLNLSKVKPQKKLLELVKKSYRHINWGDHDTFDLQERLKPLFTGKDRVQLIDQLEKRPHCMDMSIDSQDLDMSLDHSEIEAANDSSTAVDVEDLSSISDLFRKLNSKGCVFSYSSKLNLLILCLLSKGFSSKQIRKLFEIISELFPSLLRDDNYKLPTWRYICYMRSCFSNMNEYFFKLFTAKAQSLSMLTDGRYWLQLIPAPSVHLNC